MPSRAPCQVYPVGPRVLSCALWALCVAHVSMLAMPTHVHAGGIEYAGSGTVGIGRAGATAARADDPLVLMNNPAGLAELQGHQLLLSLTYVDMRACFEPSGYYGWGVYYGGKDFQLSDPDTGEVQRLNLDPVTKSGAAEEAYYVDPLDGLCGNVAHTPLPQAVWGSRITRRLGIGFGFIFPSAQPAAQWGEGIDGVIHGDTGELRPAPTRYMQIRSGNLALFPSIGAGYRLSDAVRLGVMLQWGLFSIDMTTMAAQTGGTSPHKDMLARVRAEDYFVPAVTASVHFVPHDAWDIVLVYKYQAAVDASGDLELTTGQFAAEEQAPGTLIPYTDKDLRLTSVHQEMPDKLSLGVRFADRLVGRTRGTGHQPIDGLRPTVIHDPLQDERWDLEFDVEYMFTSEVNETVVLPKSGQFPVIASRGGTFSTLRNPVADVHIKRNWNDQVSLRLGGTYNPLPGLLGISAGVHYENRGADPAYMSVDFWPLQRLGLHTGLILRLTGQVDIAISYAHIFQETLVVSAPAHSHRASGGFDKSVGVLEDNEGAIPVLEEEPLENPDGEAALAQNLSVTGSGSPPWISNAGVYTSGFDILSVGVNLHW